MVIVYTLLSVFVVSLISIVVALPLLIKKKISNKTLLFLLSVSVGVLLATVFMDFLPEIIEHGYNFYTACFVLSGFMIMFILEKFVHFHHNKNCEHGDCGHSHAYNLAPINLIGDSIHNFIDGLVIAGAYAVNITLGLTATVSIIFHEIPQEMADMGVLLYSGLSRKKAIIFNFLSATSAILGAIIGLLLINKIESFSHLIIPFAAGNFIYIAATNLTPQLHRHCKLQDSIIHVSAIVLGIIVVSVIIALGPAHVH